MTWCCVNTRNEERVASMKYVYSNDDQPREITTFICNRAGRNYCGETAEWGERERERERESETVCCREVFLALVINLSIGQISQSLEMANLLE